MMEVIETKRGGQCLIVDGFRFRKDKDRQEVKTWRCCSTGCKVRCSTNIDITRLLSDSGEHNHIKPTASELEYERIRTATKRKAVEHPSQSASLLVCEEAVGRPGSFSHQDLKNLTDAALLARSKFKKGRNSQTLTDDTDD